LPSGELVIHIRSGDIFSNRPHSGYIMPPLSYYTDILTRNNFSKVYVIASDTKNPVIPKLVNLYPTIVFNIQDLKQDIQLLLGATHVVMSFGTFTSALLVLSDHIKVIYKPSYQEGLLLPISGVSVISTDLGKYRDQQKPWKNTDKQRKFMLDYPKKSWEVFSVSPQPNNGFIALIIFIMFCLFLVLVIYVQVVNESRNRFRNYTCNH
jgi:hypothetical protein